MRGLELLDLRTHNQSPVRADALHELAKRYTEAVQAWTPGRVGQIKTLLRDAVDAFSSQGQEAEARLIRDLFFGDTQSPTKSAGELLQLARRRLGYESEKRFAERRHATFRIFAEFLIRFVERIEGEDSPIADQSQRSTAYAAEEDRHQSEESAWLRGKLTDRPGRICVLDTNALLHYTRFDQLPWQLRIHNDRVRLVIPLTVINQLDQRKYRLHEETRQRARELLTLIDAHVTANPPDGYSTVSEGVTVEVLSDELGLNPAASSDLEILDQCELLRQVTGNPITLITGDLSMRISAQARDIDIFMLSSDDLLPKYR